MINAPARAHAGSADRKENGHRAERDDCGSGEAVIIYLKLAV
jgi:hypothetical protein